MSKQFEKKSENSMEKYLKVKIPIFKHERDPSNKRTRFFQNFEKGKDPCFFDLSDDIQFVIEINNSIESNDSERWFHDKNPKILILNMEDHGYFNKFQVMTFPAQDDTQHHPPTTMFKIDFGNFTKRVIGRVFDNAIFSRLDSL